MSTPSSGPSGCCSTARTAASSAGSANTTSPQSMPGSVVPLDVDAAVDSTVVSAALVVTTGPAVDDVEPDESLDPEPSVVSGGAAVVTVSPGSGQPGTTSEAQASARMGQNR